MRWTIPAFVVALTTLIACERPRQSDLPEIRERYAFRHQGTCASWLYSFKTGFKYCATPAFRINDMPEPEVEEPLEDGEVTLADLSARGEIVYGKICVACHQADGKGLEGQFPPLAGAKEYYGDDPKTMANIIVNGLQGEIVVLGKPYNGVMPAQAQLSDYEVASVATFVRNSFGNSDGIVTPDDVKAVR